MADLHTLPPRLRRVVPAGLDAEGRAKLAGHHGALALAQMRAVRASAEWAITGSEVDRQSALLAIHQANWALQAMLLLADPALEFQPLPPPEPDADPAA